MCQATTKSGNVCSHAEKYGVLCYNHARILAGTPSGYPRVRLIERHFRSIAPHLLVVAQEAFETDNGIVRHRTRKADSYRVDVIEFVERHSQVTAEEISQHLLELSNGAITRGKVGQLVRMMLHEGSLERLSSGLYRLDSSLEADYA